MGQARQLLKRVDAVAGNMVMQVAKTQAMPMPGGEWEILKINYLIKLYLILGTTLKFFLHTFRLEFKAELVQQTLQIVQPPVCVIGYLSNASALCRSGETTAASLTGRAGGTAINPCPFGWPGLGECTFATGLLLLQMDRDMSAGSQRGRLINKAALKV